MKPSLIFVFLFTPLMSYCQLISGKIETIKGEKILSANVIIKDSAGSPVIKEFTIARNGNYVMRLKKHYTSLAIEVTATGYKKGISYIDSLLTGKDYIINFSLVPDSNKVLDEVTVTASSKPFKVKGDTVTFSVAGYKDGADKKIQDVIKRLPGMQVDERTGEIRYKGKAVETVKLDGEDLFAANYAIGTKNINADMIDQVQAIENYSDNPLLKGIEAGEKVALNLTLKNKQTDYSGSVDLGLGINANKNAVTDVGGNLLGISKSYKSFATLSFNNIGINNTPFDYFSYKPDADQAKESNFLAQQFIPETYFDIAIDPFRNNLNKAVFTSYNAAFKMGKKIRFKTNLYYLQDDITATQADVNTIQINNYRFITSNSYSYNKKPKQYRGDLDLNYNISKQSLLEYQLRYKNENIFTSSNIVQNGRTLHNTNLASGYPFHKQSLTYTKKIGTRKAFQFITQYSSAKAPQEFGFTPAAIGLPDLANKQHSNFKKTFVNARATLMGSTSKTKFSISAGAESEENEFSSALLGIRQDTTSIIPGFQNNFTYLKRSIYYSLNYKWQVSRFRLMPSVALTHLNQKLLVQQKETKTANNILIEPVLSAGYKLSNYSSFLFTSALKQKPFKETFLAENPIFISNRISINSNATLQLQKNKTAGLFYIYNNLYKQLQIQLNAGYTESTGDYFPEMMIDTVHTSIRYFYLPENNQMFTAGMLVEKYIPVLQSTLRVKSNYSLYSYKNFLNNSGIRSNQISNLSSEFFFKTAFDYWINIENNIRYNVTRSVNKNMGFSYHNININDQLKISIKPVKQMFCSISADYYLPDASNLNTKNVFIDMFMNYASKKKTYTWGLTAKNILNKKQFIQYEINDYSATVYQAQLMPFYLMLSVSRSF